MKWSLKGTLHERLQVLFHALLIKDDADARRIRNEEVPFLQLERGLYDLSLPLLAGKETIPRILLEKAVGCAGIDLDAGSCAYGA